MHEPLFGCEVHCSSWISLVLNTQGTKYHQWSIQICRWGLCPLTWWSAAENAGLQESVNYMALSGCVQWWGTLYGYQLEGNCKKVGLESVSWHKADTNWEWRSEVLIYHYDPIWTCMYAKLIFQTEKYQQCMATHTIKWPERHIPACHVHGCHMWVMWLLHASLQLYVRTYSSPAHSTELNRGPYPTMHSPQVPGIQLYPLSSASFGAFVAHCSERPGPQKSQNLWGPLWRTAGDCSNTGEERNIDSLQTDQ